jgi:hypothetical protein
MLFDKLKEKRKTTTMDIISAILFLSSFVAGIALLEKNCKALQIFYAISLVLITGAIFLNIATDSPKQFADVFLTKDYAIMIPIAINAQLLVVNILNYFKPKQAIKLTPIRILNLALYTNFALVVIMSLSNNILA